MRVAIITSLIFILHGCGEPNVKDMISSINNGNLIEMSYEVGSVIHICEPETSQQLLAQWSSTLKKPEIASWADADEHINLKFKNSDSYRVKVTFSQKFGYSTIRMGDLYVGEVINIGNVCNNT